MSALRVLRRGRRQEGAGVPACPPATPPAPLARSAECEACARGGACRSAAGGQRVGAFPALSGCAPQVAASFHLLPLPPLPGSSRTGWWWKEGGGGASPPCWCWSRARGHSSAAAPRGGSAPCPWRWPAALGAAGRGAGRQLSAQL